MVKPIDFRIRTREVIKKTRDVSNLDRKIRHFMRHKIVKINKGLLKGFEGRIVGKPIPLYSKKDFYAKVKIKDISKGLKWTVGKDTYWFQGKRLKPISKPYKTVVPKFIGDVR